MAMKNWCSPIIILSLITASFAQTLDTPYTVATWRGFRAAALSHTFDDGCSNQFAIAIPMFNEKAFKLTLFTVVSGGMFPGWQKLQSAASQGHEIASHTMTHTSLNGMSAANQTGELKNSRDSINAHIPGKQCVTLAYPYCDRGTDDLCNQYYIASRTCSGQIMPKSPTNFADISSIICGSQYSSNNSTTALNNQANSAASSNGWCVYLFHGVENDGGYSPVSKATLQGHVDYLSQNPTKFWVETFGNVARYIRERNAVSVRTLSRTADSIVVRITDGLNDTIFNYPLTIRRPLPSGWQTIKVTQGTRMLAVQTKDSNNIRYLSFDAVPDSGDVVIAQNSTLTRWITGSDFGSGSDMKVKWRRNCLELSEFPTDGRMVSIAFFDLQGRQLCRISRVRLQKNTIIIPAYQRIQKCSILVINDHGNGQARRFLIKPPEIHN
jgi:peptidoglycan/xylan/chitin deacetylase (PgdA/CDA1 family)